MTMDEEPTRSNDEASTDGVHSAPAPLVTATARAVATAANAGTAAPPPPPPFPVPPPTPPTTTAPPPPSPLPRPPSPILTARILTLVLQNGLALATHQPRPHSIHSLNALRTLLLSDAFFDPSHLPEELGPRTRPGAILFMDLVVLLGKLVRVLMREGPRAQGGSRGVRSELRAGEMEERVEVRNACLDQPFFQRWVAGSGRPFGGAEEEVDEGVEV